MRTCRSPVWTTRALNRPTQKGAPQVALALDELIHKGTNLLKTPERLIADLRKAGRSWDEVGKQLGMNGDACRKRLHRAAARIVRELGLEVSTDD